MGVWGWVVAGVAAGVVCGVVVGRAEGQPTFGKPKQAGRPVQEAEPSPEPGESRPVNTPPVREWREGDPERRAPSMDAEGGKVYAWKTGEGVRYAWSLPFGFERGEAYTVVVMLHPAGQDFRWGFSTHARTAEGFRPGDILVSVDGLAGDERRPDQRSFEVNEKNMVRFRDIMLEITRAFPSKHLILYGRGGKPMGEEEGKVAWGGGGFAVAFAGSFPALADGVLVHAGGIDERMAVKSTVPIVFMHGAKDPSTPLRATLDAQAAFVAKKHERVRVRVLRGFNDFPNPARASECISYLEGMLAAEGEEAISAAREMLRPKAADDFGYRAPVWYAGAHEVLERLGGAGEWGLKEAGESLQLEARGIQDSIEKEAERHSAALGEIVQAESANELALDGGAWIGYLMAFRDDFRGVPSAEQYVAGLGLDGVMKVQAEKAEEVMTAWGMRGESASAGEAYETIVGLLPSCYLYEALPVELVPWLRAATRKADQLGLSDEGKGAFEYATLMEQGWREGLDAYARVWREWAGAVEPAKGAGNTEPKTRE